MIARISLNAGKSESSGSTLIGRTGQFQSRHVDFAEYFNYVRSYARTPDNFDRLLLSRRQFVEKYPDLGTWFQVPLAERVGRLHGEDRTKATYPVSFRGRPYLMFLAMQGYARFDLEWILAVPRLCVWHQLDFAGNDLGISALAEDAVRLGYSEAIPFVELRYIVGRIFLHTGIAHAKHITDYHLTEFLQAVHRFAERPDIALFFGSAERYRQAIERYTRSLHILNVVLYHRGQICTQPSRSYARSVALDARVEPRPVKPRMEAIVDQYIAERRLTDRPSTVESISRALRLFIGWLSQVHPELESLADVTRDHLIEFAEALNGMVGVRTKKLFSLNTKRMYLAYLSLFFRRIIRWESPEGVELEVPSRPLLGSGDVPKEVHCLPRYIPDNELERLMPAIRSLECPYQRTALLVARWSGARRDEIHRLSVDCLDSYPDGTARLRLPAGKTKRERIIPLHEEAADAIKSVQALRSSGDRGLRDTQTGLETRYLFVRRGKLLSSAYLFEHPLRKACMMADLVTAEGKATVTAHRFRHTVATQLARKGAKLNTIMRVLGHECANHTMVYMHISDQEVLDDYKAALRTDLQPGMSVAGPFAEILRTSRVSSSDVAWLKAKFIKTELELGECLRLPEEGPCECDLYLYCSRFITSPSRAPRLQQRRRLELDLAGAALSGGDLGEAERHRRYASRFEQCLIDLGEPISEEG